MRTLVILLLLSLLLAVTNPSLNDFQDYMQDQFLQQAIKEGYGDLVGIASLIKGAIGFDAVETLTKTVLLTTHRKNLGVISIYEVTINNKIYSFLGLFKNFMFIRER